MPPVGAAIAAASAFIAESAAGVALAVGASSATAISVYGAAAWLTTTAITVSAITGINYVAQSVLAPHGGGGGLKSAAGGIVGTMGAGDTLARSFIVGHTATAGSLVYVGSWTQSGSDTPNNMLTYVVAVSDLPSGALTNVIVDEKRCVWNTGLNTSGEVEGYSLAEFELNGTQYCWVSYYSGGQTNASTFLTDKFGADPDYPWDSSFIGFGMTYAVVTFKLNQNMFPGFPRTKFELDGTNLYDARLDAAAGGSGTNLFQAPASWSGSSNPIVGIHNILRGIRQPSGLENLVAWSDNLSSWTLSNASVTSTTDIAADGTLSATKLAETGATALHSAGYTVSSLTSGTLYTYSVYVAANDRNWAYVGIGAAYVYIDLMTGTVGTVSGSIKGIRVRRAHEGYWRVSMTFDPGGSSATVYVAPATGDLGGSYAGSAGLGINVWGAQLVEGSDPQQVTNTAGASANVWTWFYGLQDLSDFRVPFDALVAAANACDVIIADGDAINEEQFRWGVEIFVDAPPIDAINEALKACNARCAEIGGFYKFSVGSAGAAIYTYDDAAIMVDYPQTFDQFPDDSQLINGVNAKYPEPEESWNMKDAPSIQDMDMRESDGGRDLKVSLSYGSVPYKWQVQRLMQSALEESRKFRKHVEGHPPNAYIIEPNDIVAKTSTMNSYSSKLFRVDRVTALANLDVMLAISEVDPADYDFDPDNDYTAVDINQVAGGDAVGLTPPTLLTVHSSFKSLVLKWFNTFNFHLEATEIWRSDTSSFGGASKVAEVAPSETSWIDEGLDTITQSWYWIRYRNDAEAFSAYEPSSAGPGATNSTNPLSSDDISSDYIRTVLAAGGLTPIEEVTVNPVTGNYEGRTIYNTTDQKLRIFQNGAFVDVIDQVALNELILNNQIPDASITSDKLAPGSVIASKLAALLGGVLNSDPNTNDIATWFKYDVPASPATNWGYSIEALGSNGKVGSNALKGTTGTAPVINKPLIPVDLNNTYRLHMWFLSDGAANGMTYLKVAYYDAAGAYLSGVDSALAGPLSPSTSWQEVSAQFGGGTSFAIPSTARFMAPEVSLNQGGSAGVTWAQDIRLEEVISTARLKDASVTTVKISDASVTTAKLGDASVTESKVGAGAVTESKIGANSVTTAKIGDLSVTTTKIGDRAITGVKAEFIGGTVVDELMVVGTGLNSGGVNQVVVGGRVDVNSTSGGLTLTVIRKSDHSNVSYRVDGTASGTLVNNHAYDTTVTSGSNLLAAAIGRIRSTEGSSVLVILTSYIAWENGVTQALADQIIAIGGSSAFLTAAQSGFTRRPYLLIGSPDLGIGRGIEIVNSYLAAAGPATYDGMLFNGMLAGLGGFAEGKISAELIQAGAVIADKIAAGAVITSKLAAGAVVAGTIAANAVGTNQLAAGSVTAGKIAAGEILTSKLQISPPGSALNSDPNCVDDSSWELTGFSSISYYGGDDRVLYSSSSDARAINRFPSAVPLPQDAKTYRIKGDVLSGAGTNGTIFIGVMYFGTTPGNILGTIFPAAFNVPSTNSWRTFEGTFSAAVGAVPGATSMAPVVYGNIGTTVNPKVYFKDVRLEEALPSTLIKDGAITTDKIFANAVNASKIAADAIIAGHISAGAINSQNMIVDDLIVTGHLTGGAVNTSKLAAGAATGLRYVAGADMDTLPSSYTDHDYHNLCYILDNYTGSLVLVNACALIHNPDNTTHEIRMRILRDGIRIWPQRSESDAQFQLRAADSQTVSPMIGDSPGEGVHTYEFQAKILVGGSTNMSVYSPNLQVVEVKR